METILPEINASHILECIPEYVLLIDKNCTIHYINKVADYASMENVLGSKVSLYTSKSEFSKIQTAVDSVFKTGQHVALDVQYNKHWQHNSFQLHLLPYKQKSEDFDLLIAVNIDNRLLVETKLEAEANEFKFKKIVELIPDSVMQTDKNLNIVYHNRLESLPKEKIKELIGKPVFNFLSSEEEVHTLKNQMANAIATGKSQTYEIRGYDKIKGNRWFQGNCTAIMKGDKNDGFIIHAFDITRQKLEQEKTEKFNQMLEELVTERTLELEKANEEITVLLQEMHHRVKNNLQIINSLLSLQSQFVRDESKEILQLCQNRIQSMALVHEMLYINEKLSSVNINDYIHTLCRSHIVNLPNTFPVDFNINIQPELQHIDVGTMITIGLLINELISNTLKHAFGGIKEPKISLELIVLPHHKKGFNTQLIYEDNGLGFNQKTHAEGLGSLLIDSFIGQLDGTFEIKSTKKGVHYTFLFNL